jgi:seryl-tRNA synthetase
MELLARVRLHAQVAHQQAQLRHALQALQEGRRALLETNAELQREMAQRKQAQQALAEVQAQMDALTNVNVSVSLIAERLRGTPMTDLPNVAELLRAHESDLGAYFTSDPVGQQLPGFLDMLAQHWTSLQEELTGEVERLRGSVEQLKDIVNRQQRLG